MIVEPGARFSSRVGYYQRFRPSYPDAVVEALAAACGLGSEAVVADIGSGTGIFSRLLLDTGARVFGVEPNPDMRQAAERRFDGELLFESVAGSAEATDLPTSSVDLVVCAQAFHWFDRERCRVEFRRILRPPGWVALIWNRRLQTTPFMQDYEAFLREYGTDYEAVTHARVDGASIADFFEHCAVRARRFRNDQSLDREALHGRVLSASYMPAPGHPGHTPMLEALDRLFERFAEGGRVHLVYVTTLYLSRLQPTGDRSQRDGEHRHE